MFREPCPDFRTFPEAVAFFPQAVDENSFKYLFPTISDTINALDLFCVFSLSKQIVDHSARAASGSLLDRETVHQLVAD